MTITAAWGTDDPAYRDTDRRMTISTPEDLATLITELGDERSGAARLVHTARPLAVDEEGMAGLRGAAIVDHDVLVGVAGGFGYLSYFSPEFDYAVAELVGDPNSPELVADPTEFHASTGVPLDTLTRALKEFLLTAQRPACVQWQDA